MGRKQGGVIATSLLHKLLDHNRQCGCCKRRRRKEDFKSKTVVTENTSTRGIVTSKRSDKLKGHICTIWYAIYQVWISIDNTMKP